MIIAGIGCRRQGSAEWVQAAIDAGLAQTGRGRADIAALATSPARAAEPAIQSVAQTLGLRLITVSDADLTAAAPRCLSDSARVRAATGLPSVSECAALAAAGPEARLLAPRTIHEGATCALAETA
ncbi:MAG: cobalamin biosynthesis protein [Rhodopila sp.]